MNSPNQPPPSAHDIPAPERSHVNPKRIGLKDAVRAGWYRQSTNELREGFAINSTDTVLDVGCGAGMASIFAAQRGAKVISADIDQKVIDDLAQRMGENASWQWRGIQTDATPIPLDDEIATRIIAMEVIEHVADPAQVMGEFWRVAAPGALLLCSAPDAQSEALQRTVAPESYFQFPNHIRVLDAYELDAIITNAGFEIVRRHSYSFYWNVATALFWLSISEKEQPPDKTAQQFLTPPFPPMVEAWAQLWDMVLNHPNGEAFRTHLDAVMPKSRIVIARKPLQAP